MSPIDRSLTKRSVLTVGQEVAKRYYDDASEEWLPSYLDKVRS